MDDFSNVLIIFVNGEKIEVLNPNPEWTLLYYLRNKLLLCGTKLGCGEGGCGACTVMVSKYDRKQNKTTHFPVNACLAPFCSMHGLSITTIEGIGSTRTKLHPIQEKLAKAHGSQCGFCTPGIIMSMYTLLRNMEIPSMKDIEIAFQGNLCRCTGYRPILEAFRAFTDEWNPEAINNKQNGCPMGENCCKLQENGTNNMINGNISKLKEQQIIFPPELKLNVQWDLEGLHFKGEEVVWFRPQNIQQLLQLKQQYPYGKIIVGNTEIGIEVKFKDKKYPVLIYPSLINELNEWRVSQEGLLIGASITLDHFEAILQQQIDSEPEYKTRIFSAFIQMLHWFAGKQIRSVASVGGNIITGSPISDLNPLFMAAGAVLELRSSLLTRHIRIDEKFFIGYRKSILRDDEVLVNISIPFSHKNQFFLGHKQARRRDDDIAIVNAAINVTFIQNTNIIDNISLAYGGMGCVTLLALKTQNALKGLAWNENILETAYENLLQDFPLSQDAPGGMVDYRKTLSMCFFFRSYITILNCLSNKAINAKDLSAINKFDFGTPKSSQIYQIVPNNQDIQDPIGRPIVHVSALKQVAGEAVYVDDIPHFENELQMALVYSKKAHAIIKSINFEDALRMKGVKGFISGADLTEDRNKFGSVVQDEKIFATNLITSQYQVLGAIVAVDQSTAQKAAKNVKVLYEELQPVIVSIEDAIAHNSFLPSERKLEIGNIDHIFSTCKNIKTGECRTGYQEHFYFETHGCLVVPKEDELEVFSSTQHHAEVTAFISRTLNIPQNRVHTRVKRIGGGFGGKQSRAAPIAVATAIAAHKFKRPVRLMLDRDEDMASTGGRHPYLIRYKVAFDDDGKILAYEANMFANGGYSNDLSTEVLERAMFHIENTYKIENLRVTGRICKTNLPTNTAFRGFGAPQSMFAAENMIRTVAEHLNKDYVEICKLNLYKEGDVTHYNQLVENCNLKECLEECLIKSSYEKRKKDNELYNKKNRWKKRGISVVCTKYGVGFGVPFLEQSGALVMVYTDGSVLLTHGGVEMGQGLYTKMIQIAARVLDIPVDKIYTSECSTDKVPNTSPSAASVGSDLNGMAVLEACEKIKKRLEPIKAKNPKGKWEDWIESAYMERINLSATGYYCTPDIVYNWETNTGKPYNYYTYGAACTEVEIDCLTGDHQVLRTDIVMDLGCSLNPAIDIGQIEGAFMQGYGLFVLEEMVYSPKGTIYSKGPGAYKIPGFSDIPIEFNVSLLKCVSNPRAVYSSKAVGEPPLFLASSALFAIREAIKESRREHEIYESFILNAPATAEKIRMYCQDCITDKIKNKYANSTWNVEP